MRNIIKAEMFKQKHCTATFRCFLIYIVLVLAVMSLKIFTYDVNNSADTASLVSSFAALAPFFVLILTTSLAVSDIENHTLKNLLASGISRGNIYLGKMFSSLALCIVVAIFGALAIALGSTVSLFMYNKICGDSNIYLLLARYGLEIIALIMYTLLFFGVSMITKSNRTALTVNMVIFFVLPLIQAIVAQTTHNELFIRYQLTSDISEALMTSTTVNALDVCINMAIFVAIIIVVNIIGYARFKKIDV